MSSEKPKQENKHLDVFDFNEKDEENHSSDHSSTPPGGANNNEHIAKKNEEDIAKQTTDKTPPHEKKKKRKHFKDVNAPKAPLTGYIRFLNDYREKVRDENPDMPFTDVTRMLATKWANLGADDKQVYQDEYEREREEYLKTLQGYQKSDAYKEFQKKKRKQGMDGGGGGGGGKKVHNSHSRPRGKEERHKSSTTTTTTPKCNGDVPDPTAAIVNAAAIAHAQGPKISVEGAHIPIFTEQFLEYNRKRETDLRQLRKENSGFEEQNAVLNKQIDHMKSVMDRVKSEILEQENENNNMQNFLDKISRSLHAKFEKVIFPRAIKEQMLSTDANIDKKLSQLAEFISNGKGDDEIIDLKKKVKEMISSLDYPTMKYKF